MNVHEAKTHLSRLLRRVAAGEDIVISRAGRPVAKLVPIEVSGRRQFGYDQGRLQVPDDFDAPLSEEVLSGFET